MKKIISLIIVLSLSIFMFSCDNNQTLNNYESLVYSIFSDVDLNNVTEDLNFPLSLADGSELKFESTNTDIISNTGKVTRPKNDTKVKVICTITVNSESYDVILSFNVKGLDTKSTTKTNNSSTSSNTTKDESSKTTKNNSESKENTTISTSVLKIEDAPSLENILSSFNFRIDEVVSTKEKGRIFSKATEEEYFYIYNNDFVYSEYTTYDDYYDEYLVKYYCVFDKENNTNYVLYEYEDDKFYKIPDTSEYFDSLNGNSYYDFNFDDQNYDIEVDDEYYIYTCKKDSVTTEGNNFIETFTEDDITYNFNHKSLEIYVKDNQVEKIVLKTEYKESTSNPYLEFYIDDSTYSITYTLKFSEYGQMDYSLPEDITLVTDQELDEYFNSEDEEEENEFGFSDFYNDNITPNFTELTCTGYITGFTSDSILIADETGTITVYIGKNMNYYTNGLEIGDYISISGYKQNYSGLIELRSYPSTLTKDDNEYSIIPHNNYSLIEDFSETTKQGEVINLIDFNTVTEYKKKTSSSGDYVITLKDSNDDEISVIFKGTIASNIKDSIEEITVGSKISLYNLAISYYKNSYELIATTNVSLESDTIILNYQKLTVEYNTEISEALKDLTVKYDNEEINKEDYTIDTSGYIKDQAGTYIIKVQYNGMEARIYVTVLAMPVNTKVDDTTINLEKACDNLGISSGLKSTGDVNILVIPIQFSDKEFEEGYKEKLEIAFNGTSEETGWESLKSYYYKSSYSKLNINATILDAYTVDDTWRQVKNKSENSYLDYEYLLETVTYYDKDIDYSLYDSNGDTYIDCIYLVYSAPYDSNGDSMWWAYTNTYLESGEESRFDGMGLYYYIFFSYEFLNDPIQTGYNDFSTSDDLYINVNSETIIHETGHALGLDDYYDYDSSQGPDGGIGGGDMMDYNVGDHNAYSKAILGWIKPTVLVSTTGTFNLDSFEESGDAIIIAKSWDNSLFTEYYIIDYYTPTGVNELNKGYNGLFSESGIRIYHIIANLDTNTSDVVDAYDITYYDNSYTKYKLISLVEADNENNILKGGSSENSDLFEAGDTYTFKWYDGSTSGLTMTVDSIGEEATITISK